MAEEPCCAVTKGTDSSRLMKPARGLFVPQTVVTGNGFRSLTEGARVSYEAEAGAKRPAGRQGPAPLAIGRGRASARARSESHRKSEPTVDLTSIWGNM